MSRQIHICMSARGALNQCDSDLRGLVKDGSGRPMTARMVRKWLQYQLAMGREKLPLGEPCDGFDYKTGCPGHEVSEE